MGYSERKERRTDHWLRIGGMCRMAVAIVAIGASAVGAAEQENAIVKEEFLVQGRDQGVKLFVREKRLSNLPKITKKNVVLFVHGLPGPGDQIDRRIDLTPGTVGRRRTGDHE